MPRNTHARVYTHIQAHFVSIQGKKKGGHTSFLSMKGGRGLFITLIDLKKDKKMDTDGYMKI